MNTLMNGLNTKILVGMAAMLAAIYGLVKTIESNQHVIAPPAKVEPVKPAKSFHDQIMSPQYAKERQQLNRALEYGGTVHDYAGK